MTDQQNKQFYFYFLFNIPGYHNNREIISNNMCWLSQQQTNIVKEQYSPTHVAFTIIDEYCKRKYSPVHAAVTTIEEYRKKKQYSPTHASYHNNIIFLITHSCSKENNLASSPPKRGQVCLMPTPPSEISGLSFHFRFLSPPLFFCLVLLFFLSCRLFYFVVVVFLPSTLVLSVLSFILFCCCCC